MNTEDLEKLFASDEGGDLRSFVDKRVSGAIETYRKNHPLSDEAFDRLAKLEEAYAETEKAYAVEKLQHYAYRKCTENGIDVSLLDGFNLSDEKAVDDKVSQLSGMIRDRKQSALEELIGSGGYKPRGGIDPERKSDWKALSMDERISRLNAGENPTAEDFV